MSILVNSTTRVITLQVTSSDAQGSANVANALADCVSNVAQEVMNVESVNVIDEAPTPEAPSGPNRMLYVAVAAMAGLFAAVAIVVLMDVIDTRVRSAEDVEELLELPVIGRITHEQYILDVRTIRDGEFDALVQAVSEALA